MLKTKIVVYAINLILIVLVVLRVYEIHNDKGHLLFMFYCPFIAFVNFLIGLVLKLCRSQYYKVFWTAAGLLLILYVPVYIFVLQL